MKITHCDFKPLTKASVPSHAHACIEWHYVIAGRCGFDIAERRLEIGVGDLFAIEPGASHGVRMRKRDDWLLQYIIHAEIESDEDQEIWRAWQQKTGPSEIISIGSGRHGLFARLSGELSHQDPWRQRSASHRFTSLLCDCLAGDAVVDDTHPHIQTCLRIMHQSLYEVLSLDEMAATLQLNKSYLIRLFKQHIGQAPLQYFTHLKMELAARLLRDENMSVQDVAQRIGYQAAAHFSRMFKQWSGLSPAHYQHAHRSVPSSHA